MTVKKLFIYIPIAILLIGCSTKKNTWLSRNYHDMTAHYNVYFNGKESMKEGVKSIQESNQDNYTQILPVFPDSKKEAVSEASSNMDRSIEKGVKLIKKHSIRKKPKKKKDNDSKQYKDFISQNEFNKWVDNAYLMIGKAHFMKHEFYVAQQSFSYMFREFRIGPEWYEAQLYMARSYIEIEDYAMAKIILDVYDLEGKAPYKLYGFFAAIYADYYLRQDDIASAIPFMKTAAESIPGKYYRTRFYFILAQLYHNQNMYAEASAAYKKVILANPPYELAFNAKVNRVSVVFEEEGFAAVLKEVKKLLRDKRNQDYTDQIYYALGKAYLAEQQEQNATDNFILSIQSSIDNTHQKGLSFYELAKIEYNKPIYREAYYNLDSAVLSLNKDFPQYEELFELNETLEELVTNLDVIAHEDSIQRIAKMDSLNRLAFIDQLIEDEIAREEEAKRQQEEFDNGDFFFDNNNMNASNDAQGGKWYFYNQNSISMGKMEFEKRWGRRKLEDNWRRANKEVVIEEPLNDPTADPEVNFGNDPWGENPNDTIPTPGDSNETNTPTDLKNRDTYLRGLPLTEEAIVASDKKIEGALLSEGLIYKDDLENIPFAIDAFNELIRRFGSSTYTEDALMNLYLCYEKQEDSQGMAQTKAQLMLRYPDGEFTAYLNDPEFFEKRAAREKQMEELYQNTYNSYLFNDFVSPVNNEKQAFVIDEKSELLPKFVLLSALSHAKTGVLTQFESDLKRIINDYPESEPVPMAKELLAEYEKGRVPVIGPVESNLIDKRNDQLAIDRKNSLGNSKGIDIPSSYNRSDKAVHSLVIIINPEADMNRLRFNLADYNFSKFLLNDYEMLAKKLPDGTPILEVAGFKNRLEAQDYFYSLRERDQVFEVPELTRYNLYVITQDNLEYMISSGDQSAYNKFFEENYLSAESFKNYSKEEVKELISPDVEETAPKEKDKSKLEVTQDTEIPTEQNTDKTEVNTQKEEIASEPEKQNEVPNEAQEEIKQEVAVVTPPAEAVVEEKPEIVEQTPDKVEEPSNKEVTEEVTAVVEPEVETFIAGEGPHNAYILFKKGSINTTRLSTVFTNYTKTTFGTEYKVTSGAIAGTYLFIKVSGFANTKSAEDYIQKVKFNDFLMRDINRVEHYLWSITDLNLIKIKNKDSFDEYDQFYKLNY